MDLTVPVSGCTSVLARIGLSFGSLQSSRLALLEPVWSHLACFFIDSLFIGR